MEKMLLWFEILAAVLLVHATLTACIARFAVPEFRMLLYVFLCLPGIFGFGVLTAFVGYWRFAFGAQHFPFYYVSTLAALYLLGIVPVGWKGIRLDREHGRSSAAANWPLGKLAAAAAVAVVFQSTTLMLMDLAVHERIGRWKTEAAAMALSVAPQRPAETENAAPLYLRAIHNLRQDPSAKLDSWLGLAPEPGKLDVKDPVLRAFLERHESDISLLREAAARPRCYFEHEFGRPRPDILLPESQDLRLAAVMLSIHARMRAADNDLAAASKDIAAMFACSRHAAEEPFRISALIAAGLHRLTTQTLADVLSTNKLTEQQLSAFAVPSDLVLTRLARRSMQFEEAMTLGSWIEMRVDPLPGEVNEVFASQVPRAMPRDGFKEMLQRPYPLVPQKPLLLPLYRVFLLPHEVLLVRQGFAKLRVASAQLAAEGAGGYRRFREAVAAIDAEVGTRRAGLLPPLVWEISWGNDLAELFAANGETDLARVVLAAARFRAKHGKYPQRLDQLVPAYLPAVPLDPLTDKPLGLRISGSGWTVFMQGDTGAGRPRELTLHERGD